MLPTKYYFAVAVTIAAILPASFPKTVQAQFITPYLGKPHQIRPDLYKKQNDGTILETKTGDRYDMKGNLLQRGNGGSNRDSFAPNLQNASSEQQRFCESVLAQRKSSAWMQFYKQGGCVDGSKPHFFSIRGDQSVSLRFINQKNQRVKIFWLDYQGQAKFYRTLEPGEEYTQQTYMTHPWWITDENNRPLGMLLLPDKKLDVAVIK
jgi:VHL beta domain